MQSFIEEVLNQIKNEGINFSESIFILPSKRAGTFLKSKLQNYIDGTSFSPEVLSIEEFVEQISGLRQATSLELLFKLYTVYKDSHVTKDVESFDHFSKWSKTLLQDFNEIDRYLINADDVFDYMSASQLIKRWSLETNEKELISNYIEFWKSIKSYYYSYNSELISDRIGYQGLIYRSASEAVEAYAKKTSKKHIFLGFNALNSAEQSIIQHLLNKAKGVLYWDMESLYMENPYHSAGLFSRTYKNDWSFYKENPFQWINSNYSKPKNIEVIACTKSVGQSKHIGHLLKKLSNSNTIQNTALVLGDESLLMPVLNSIPEGVDNINITMGLPLKLVPLASLFEYLFKIHQLKSKKYYYKDVIALLSNQILQFVLKDSRKAIAHIQKNNITNISKEGILELIPNQNNLINLLFGDWSSTSSSIEKCLDIVEVLRNQLVEDKDTNGLELEYLYRFNELFLEIKTLNDTYNYINDVKTLHSIYKELLNSETLDFRGEPLEGLQIMGMLESRVLDFETVIISSVNEGILPGGKTNNSFIPFDFKLNKKLPTYREKDAVYTYHFYNLIQRAKNVYILYNTEVDALQGGEKSRFITQLDVEGIHNLSYKTASAVIPKIETQLIEIEKTGAVVNKLKLIASSGFSPSSLTNYFRNPLDFYYEKVLGVKNELEVEETVAYNTLGTILHNTLENFYKPYEGKFLQVKDIETMKSSIENTVMYHFQQEFKKGDISTGKNLIIFEIAKRYISNFLDAELRTIKSGKQLKILAIETKNEVEIDIPELNFSVRLKGKVDRVDSLDGVTRIIDYKSGKVEKNKVEIVDWIYITTDYDKYSKSFQVLSYAYMMHKENKVSLPLEAGIISFKNLQSGFMKFGKKDSDRGKGDTVITTEVLTEFEKELKKLIIEICNPDLNFIEKEIN